MLERFAPTAVCGGCGSESVALSQTPARGRCARRWRRTVRWSRWASSAPARRPHSRAKSVRSHRPHDSAPRCRGPDCGASPIPRTGCAAQRRACGAVGARKGAHRCCEAASGLAIMASCRIIAQTTWAAVLLVPVNFPQARTCALPRCRAERDAASGQAWASHPGSRTY